MPLPQSRSNKRSPAILDREFSVMFLGAVQCHGEAPLNLHPYSQIVVTLLMLGMYPSRIFYAFYVQV